jgi:hypothetical protein
LKDWSKSIGVKNHNGKAISKINMKQIKIAERFFDLVNLRVQLYTGVKINAKINPTIIDNKIGFNKKKDKTKRAITILVVITFLK